MGIVIICILFAFGGLMWFSRTLWWLGVSRKDLPEGGLLQRADDAGNNLGCAVTCILLIGLAAFYLVNYVLPWFHAHFHHGGGG